jgi:hypothetical protein
MPYVDSTTISWVDYDPAARTLDIRFHASPVVYSYADVPESVYRALLEAPAKRAYYREHIESVYALQEAPFPASLSATSPVVGGA